MTLLVVLVELLIPWLKSEVLSSYGCLPSCWRTGPPLAKRGSTHFAISTYHRSFTTYWPSLQRTRISICGKCKKDGRLVRLFFAIEAKRSWGQSCCKYSVICKLLYKVAGSIVFRRLFLIKISQVNPPSPWFPWHGLRTLFVGHLEAFCPCITWRLNVDLVEWPAAF